MENINLLEQNIRFLKRSSDTMARLVAKENPLYLIKLELVEGDGNYIIEFENSRCFLNSIYNKTREMDRMFAGMNDDVKTVVIFGIGTGVCFDYLLQHAYSLEHVILVEPSLQIFKKFLMTKNVEKLVKRYKNVSFIVNRRHNDAITLLNDLLQQNINTNIFVASSVTYRNMFAEYYNILSNTVSTILKRRLTNVATSYTNTYKKIINVMNNVRNSAYDVSVLMQSFKEKTVFIVAPGASLDKNLKYLEEAKEKGILIAVGTGIQVLEKNGVRPHFRAALSPFPDTTIFKDMEDRKIPLIYSDNLYYDILPRYDGPTFRTVNIGDALNKYMYQKCEIEFTEVAAELSIANMIFEMLCLSGCKDIVLVGQDMGFVDNKMYGTGSVDNLFVEENSTWALIVKNVYGEEIATNHRFLNMRDALVRSMMRNPNRERVVTNCSEGGIEIEGTLFMTLKEKLDSLKNVADYNIELEKIIEMEKAKIGTDYRERLHEVMNELIEQNEKIREVNEERIEKLTELIKMKEDNVNPNKILQGYEKINEFEQELSRIPFYNEVVKLELDGMFNIIVSAYKYDGLDQLRQLEAVENILVRTCLEMRKFVYTFKILADEFRSKDENMVQALSEN